MKLTLNKSNISGIKMDDLKKIPWILGRHAFLVILVLIVCAIMGGIFLFYTYVVSAKTSPVAGETVKFKYNTYQNVLKEWQLKEQKFEEFADKKYQNPFSASEN